MGVVKEVNLVSVKVGLKTTVDIGSVLVGLDFVQQQKEAKPYQPAYGSFNEYRKRKIQAFDDAAAALVKAVVIVVASACNEGRDACGFSPVEPKASSRSEYLTVMTLCPRGPTVALVSCVEIYAPGDGILSAWKKDDT